MTLIEQIRKHVDEEGDCWNWTGATQTCGATPTMNYRGKVGAVRRLIMLQRGTAPNTKVLATYLCGNPKCVNPEHVGWLMRKTVQARTNAERSHLSSRLRCKKIADSARRHAKLTQELADQVREAEGAQRDIAARFGVSQATVSSIKRGRTWRTYAANPFAGLGAR